MICPKCKAEYREGFTVCSDCQVDLAESLENLSGEIDPGIIENIIDTENIENTENVMDIERKPLPYGKEDGKEVFLISANDNYQFGMMESLLNSYGIPVMKKLRGPGGIVNIYLGNSYYGTDLYVPAKFLDDAKKILETQLIRAGYETEEDIRQENTEDVPPENTEDTPLAEVLPEDEYSEKELEKMKRKRSILGNIFINIIIFLIILSLISAFVFNFHF